MMHELYCAGHLFEAGVAHYQATGKQTLLDVACRFADLIDNTFGPGKRDGLPGHEGIELALVKLARVTGEVRYMSLAEYFVRQRGHSPSIFEKELENPDLPGGTRCVSAPLHARWKIRGALRASTPPDTGTDRVCRTRCASDVSLQWCRRDRL